MTTKTNQPTIEAAKEKIEQRRIATNKAAARLRKRQRQEQSKRQEILGALVEASWGKLKPADEEALGLVLALAAGVPMSFAEILGALAFFQGRLAGPDGARVRQELQAFAVAYRDPHPPRANPVAPASSP